ncbi:uncharacterized protein LOC116805584 [Drosophila grimshawi]|uniref:uncharacterized protein LOC116805584 n=1 Tax=Drosophila grimshawi TaxID=7222 RepID=UPI0013EF3A6F|nr:uncharacterized protein LOC116805584 [Drosophila grimshawi]
MSDRQIQKASLFVINQRMLYLLKVLKETINVYKSDLNLNLDWKENKHRRIRLLKFFRYSWQRRAPLFVIKQRIRYLIKMLKRIMNVYKSDLKLNLDWKENTLVKPMLHDLIATYRRYSNLIKSRSQGKCLVCTPTFNGCWEVTEI